MAPNSLFAILLRSPWWISFAIVAAIVLLALALLPSDIAPFAAVGALPFAVIGGMAAWRQWRAPSASQVQAALADAAGQSWPAFSARLAAAWQAQGWRVQPLPAGGPADFLLEKNGQRSLVCARRWKAAHHGVEPLRALHTARGLHEATGAQYVALHLPSETAAAFARTHGIGLLQGEALAGLLLHAPAP